MRFAVLALTMLSLTACASNRLDPVPETGAFSLKYIELDGDYFVQVDKIGAPQAVSVSDSSHPNRRLWRAADWLRYGDILFPEDELNFDELRELRGSNLVPVGLVSPTPSDIPPCETTTRPDYAKIQTRIVRRARPSQPVGGVVMVTECVLHEGLAPNQYSGIHQRPNPYRFPTRYETVVDLDRNGYAEQKNLRLRNVPKREISRLVRQETDMPNKVKRSLLQRVDRM